MQRPVSGESADRLPEEVEGRVVQRARESPQACLAHGDECLQLVDHAVPARAPERHAVVVAEPVERPSQTTTARQRQARRRVAEVDYRRCGHLAPVQPAVLSAGEQAVRV